jgi:hypothetical protein
MLVGCYESANCNAGDIRLVDGNSTLEGRVEVCTQGLWGAISVFKYFWVFSRSNLATVICRQLEFPWECELYAHAVSVLHVCIRTLLILKGL